ncbi:MAG: hypothetical protein GX595_02085, partial [Lentisphaerae bacterium]|nr:hypothetical protein [Lentisphaerota bacterium]
MTTYTARIYDSGLNLLHTTTNVVWARGTWRKNDVGRGSFTFPGQDAATAAATLQNGRIVHVTTQRGGITLVVALFNIEARSFSLTEEGQELITVSGTNFEERIGRHLITAEIHDGNHGPALNDIAQIMSHVPGWSLHPTSFTGTASGTRHTFKNATGLQALAAAAEQSGEMWRLFSLSTISREIMWTRVPSGADSYNFTLYFRQPLSFNEATDALILRMDRGYDGAEMVSRIYVYGAGTGDERLTLAAATWSPPAGFSLNDSASLLINEALEATGQYCVREVVFSDIAVPELKFAIEFASDAEDYFTIRGDQTTLFVAGYIFAVEGHPSIADGTEFTVASSLYDADTDHTVVSVTGNIGTSTAGGYIVPTEDALDAAQVAAANALAQRAYYWLRDRTGGEQFHHIRAIYHRNAQPGDKVRLVYDNGRLDLTEVHQIVEVTFSIDRATGIRYMDLVLAPLDTLRLPQTESVVAGTIMATMQNLMRYGPGGRVSGGTILPTMGEHLAHPDPHPVYLRADGGRQLVGNLPVASGITIDGVDLSALNAAYLAHLPADSHTQYVHLTTARNIVARHTFAPASAASPFLLGANAQGQTVVGLRADQLNKSITAGNGLTGGGLLTTDRTLAVGAGPGITVNPTNVQVRLAVNSGLSLSGDALAVGAPETLAHNSANAVTGASHTHAVTASANPGAAESLLKSSPAGHLQLVRLGAGVAPDHPLHARGVFPQLRLETDGTHTGTIGVDSSDNMELVAPNNLHLYPGGDVVFNPGGKDLLPLANYDLNIGALHKKYLTLHAAELWVETLVAQETMATIGGRILVGPTTTLEEDIADSATEIVVKHNQMADGDIVYLEDGGKVEFMEIDSAPAGTGPYTYSVIRNLDGTGANEWFAGDAVFNTGQAGKGFIDLYSLSGVRSGAGPTIVGNVRNSATFNDWTEHWAIGNLNGLYGYGVDRFGVGLGKADANNLVLDAVDGIRFRQGGTVLASLTGTSWTIGQTTGAHITLTPTDLTLKDNSGATAINLGAAGNLIEKPLMFGAGGGIWQGTGTFASPTTGLKLYRSGTSGVLAGYNDGLEQVKIDTDGRLYAAAGGVRLDRTGITLEAYTGGTGGPGDDYSVAPSLAVKFDSAAYGTVGKLFTSLDGLGQGGPVLAATTASTDPVLLSAYLSARSSIGTPGEAYLQAYAVNASNGPAGVRLYVGGTTANEGFTVDAPLTRINGQLSTTAGLTVAGHITSENDIRAASGISAGINSINIADGNILATGNFQRRVGTTNYSGYIYVPLASATTIFNASAQGAAGTATRTRAQLGVPAAARAVHVRIMFQSATAGG